MVLDEACGNGSSATLQLPCWAQVSKFLVAQCAALAASFASYPLDTVRRYQQVHRQPVRTRD